MKKGQNTRGYERYMALDIHREYLLVGGIVPEVWVPPMEVRELRAFISYWNRLVTTSTTPALAVRCKCDPQSPAEPAA